MSKQDKKMTFAGPTAFSNIDFYRKNLVRNFKSNVYTYSALPSKKNRLFGIFLYKMAHAKN